MQLFYIIHIYLVLINVAVSSFWNHQSEHTLRYSGECRERHSPGFLASGYPYVLIDLLPLPIAGYESTGVIIVATSLIAVR